jgi:hypothetical protein
MAQGSRGRFALLGAGMLFCSGLVGCTDNDPKPIARPPLAKGSTPSGIMNSTVKQNQTPQGATTFGSGAGPAGLNQPMGGSSPSGANLDTKTPYGSNPYSANPYSTGTIGQPAVPGMKGAGTPLQPSGAVPQVTPGGSSSYQGSSIPVESYGTTASRSALPTNPPGLGYDMPPVPPAPPATTTGFPVAPTKPY